MKQFLLLLCIAFTLYNCENGIECIIARRPELPSVQLPSATTSDYYFTEFTVEVDNDPNDNDYDYFFNVEVNNLPPGLDYFVNYRTISFEGQPTETGTYKFDVNLYIEGPFDEFGETYANICENNTRKSYTIVVNAIAD